MNNIYHTTFNSFLTEENPQTTKDKTRKQTYNGRRRKADLQRQTSNGKRPTADVQRQTCGVGMLRIWRTILQVSNNQARKHQKKLKKFSKGNECITTRLKSTPNAPTPNADLER